MNAYGPMRRSLVVPAGLVPARRGRRGGIVGGHEGPGYILMAAYAALLLVSVTTPTDAKEPATTIRKSPFSSSSYRIWKEPRRGPTPRSVERVIRRNPPVGPHSDKLEQQGSHFTSDGKAPCVKPPARARKR